MKFEETGDLGVLPGRGREPVGTENVEEVATAVVERASSSQSILQQVVDQCVTFERISIVKSPLFCERRIRSPLLSCKFKASLPHLPVDELDSSGGQTGVALHLQAAREGVGSTKKPTRC
ncbi:hypothetical protein TNCV_2039921 [Trichonephila clavipes]|nr:hypothetical protein TNCV_2039921 [Trichonephila clavipes]